MLLLGVANFYRRSIYKRRHDNLGKIVHWKLARKCNFEAGDKWCEILWDFSIQTDHVIEAQRLYLVVVDKKRTCKIIDFAVPGDQDLRRELQKIWNVRVKIYH